ncbi:hypothetical protein EMIT0P258_10056 [Pseudomonas sp. IT-P258]
METRRIKSQQNLPLLQSFFTTAKLCYGSCAWDAFGRAGFLDPRFSNLRTAATHSLGNERGGFLD